MQNSVRWRTYEFAVFAVDTNWNDVGGVYIFTGLNRLGQWVALYVGQTDSFRTRIPQHERWNEAVRAGATHVHALVEQREASRLAMEAELIQAFQPPLNVQLR